MYNKSNKEISNLILYKLGELPFRFKGNIQYIENECKTLIKNYPHYENFINNYFLKNHLEYFKDGSLNYTNIPKDCRSNSFLENYNGYIKEKLGKHRLVNWVNFIEFIKQESVRSISKLLNDTNTNLKSNNSYTKTNTLKYAMQTESNNKEIIKEKHYFNFKEEKESNENNLTSISFKKDLVNALVTSTLGFKNIGDTCYMNTAIQILIHLKNFMQKIADLDINDKNTLTESFLQLMRDIYELINLSENNPFSKNSILFYSPIHFKYRFTNKYSLFCNGQHDSMEFIRLFLKELIEENNNVQERSPYYEIDNENKTKFEISQEYNKFFKSREHAFIHELFYFQTITTYSCICGYNSYACENLLEIPLLLPEEVENFTLSELLTKFFEKNDILWNGKCWSCKKKKRRHSKLIRLYNVNEYLIITLQRFDAETSKINNCLVTFESSLNLKNYLDLELYKGESCFVLKGTINHVGNLNF